MEAMQAKSENCEVCNKSFTLTSEDLTMYEKAGVPPTDMCIYCGWRYLFSFWNLGRFRIGKSDLSGKQLITVLPENVQFPVYTREEFVSDAWDPLSYGQEYDPKRPFLDQLVELQKLVPHPHQIGSKHDSGDTGNFIPFACNNSDHVVIPL